MPTSNPNKDEDKENDDDGVQQQQGRWRSSSVIDNNNNKSMMKKKKNMTNQALMDRELSPGQLRMTQEALENHRQRETNMMFSSSSFLTTRAEIISPTTTTPVTVNKDPNHTSSSDNPNATTTLSAYHT